MNGKGCSKAEDATGNRPLDVGKLGSFIAIGKGIQASLEPHQAACGHKVSQLGRMYAGGEKEVGCGVPALARDKLEYPITGLWFHTIFMI
jgi:hypothetical protein